MLSNTINNYNSLPRKGSKDIWNAALLKGATYTVENDFPCSLQCNGTIPEDLIGYDEAKSIHKKLVKKNLNYRINKYVHFYIDDQKFDGPKSSVWSYPHKALDILRHFAGVITVDFSTNAWMHPRTIRLSPLVSGLLRAWVEK